MTNPEVFEKSDSLKSGNFYAVNAIQRCYRINEPDHFLKDMETSLVGYFDKEEQFHHFNRLQSRQITRPRGHHLIPMRPSERAHEKIILHQGRSHRRDIAASTHRKYLLRI